MAYFTNPTFPPTPLIFNRLIMTDKPEPNKNMLVVGTNMGVLIGYTIYYRLTNPEGEGFIGLAFFIAMHFVICLLLAIIPRYTKAFLLSAAAVVLIGFSTCFIAYSIH
jgi:hypothetical protein